MKWNLFLLITFPILFSGPLHAYSLIENEMNEVITECKLFDNEEEFEKQKIASAQKAIEAAENDPELINARKKFQEEIDRLKPKLINEIQLKLGKVIQYRDEIINNCPYPNKFTSDLNKIACDRLVDEYQRLLSNTVIPLVVPRSVRDYLSDIYHKIQKGLRCESITLNLDFSVTGHPYYFNFNPCNSKNNEDLTNIPNGSSVFWDIEAHREVMRNEVKLRKRIETIKSEYETIYKKFPDFKYLNKFKCEEILKESNSSKTPPASGKQQGVK